MGLDYESHPAELVGSGDVGKKKVTVKDLKDAIPAYCFEPSYLKSLGFLARDLTYMSIIFYVGYNYIPLIENTYLRWGAWAFYGWANGLVWMGLWVLGHECGHGAFSKSEILNNIVGFTLHTAMLTPYFSWRSTHRRHHIYANNMVKDHNYVPPEKEEFLDSLFFKKTGMTTEMLDDLTDDAPLVTLFRIVLQQVIGFQTYMLTNMTAAETSLPGGQKPSESFLGNSHFAPSGTLFTKEEFGVVLLSDIGLAAMSYALYSLGNYFGHGTMLLMYLQPYLWVNHWIVAVTYLHHTHPDLPKYNNEAWSFIRGATATVDRTLGPVIGRHLFHNITDFHVIHHIFSRIPFYYGPEATAAVRPILGDAYHEDKERAFLPGLYESFTKCLWVETINPEAPRKDQVLMYRGSKNTASNDKTWFQSFGSVLSNVSKKDLRPKHVKAA